MENNFYKIRNQKKKPKQKEVIMIKNERLNIAKKKIDPKIPKFPQNPINKSTNEEDYYNDDLDEFSEQNDKKLITSINMKDNNINNLDKKINTKPSYKKEMSLTEHSNYIDPVINNFHGGGGQGHSRNLSSNNMGTPVNKFYNNSNYSLTPNKNKDIPVGNYTPAPRNLNFAQNNRFNNSLIFNKSNLNPSNIGYMMMNKNTQNSFVSQSNYSSSNKNPIENEDSTEIGDYSHEE